jgi:hypothetical protein
MLNQTFSEGPTQAEEQIDTIELFMDCGLDINEFDDFISNTLASDEVAW